MINAARSGVTLRHTYNLVDLPIKVAGKSGTAEFGLKDSRGRLPFHSWFVGFVPKDPVNGWEKTWAYLKELNSCIEYYPTGTGAVDSRN